MITLFIRFLVTAVLLAAWEVLLKPQYIAYLESMGRFYDIGTAALGYFMMMVLAWFIAKVLVWRMKRER